MGWSRLAEWVKNGGALPDVPELVGELIETTYSFRGDALLLEPKEQIKKRLGRSCDFANSLALTFAADVAACPRGPQLPMAHRSQENYDPFKARSQENYDPFKAWM